MSSNQIQPRKKLVLKHTLLIPGKKIDDRYEPIQAKGLQDVKDYNDFTNRRNKAYKRTYGTASKKQYERSIQSRSHPKPPVPLFGQPRPYEPKLKRQTSAYGSRMDPPAGARISQQMYERSIAPPPSFTQPGPSQSDSRENALGKAESDLLISQIGSWNTYGEPGKSSEEHHDSIEDADRREGYEKWQRDREKNGSSVKPGTGNVDC
ncbi:hypothetical protein EAE96_009865 [Botrytis aclada]|nr:hypothetical protein EAE96_009865 [Botrytis aclada]